MQLTVLTGHISGAAQVVWMIEEELLTVGAEGDDFGRCRACSSVRPTFLAIRNTVAVFVAVLVPEMLVLTGVLGDFIGPLGAVFEPLSWVGSVTAFALKRPEI